MTEQDNHSCEVYHFDLYGTREEKYRYLQTHNLNDVEWQQLNPQAPSFFFVPKDFSLQQEYEQGFKIDELMRVNTSGIKTQRDDASVFLSKKEMLAMRNDFLTLSVDELKSKYGFKDVRDWQVQAAKEDIQKNPILADKLCYRPFDIRPMLYTGKTKGIQGYPRYDKMRHLLYGYYRDTEGIVGHASERANKSTLGSVAHYPLPHSNGCATDALPFGYTNLSLVVCKQQSTFDFQHVFCTNLISDINSISLQSKEISYVFPLFLYLEEGSIETERRVNMDEAIVAKIMQCAAKGTQPSSVAVQSNSTAPEDGCVSSPVESEKVNADETSALQVFDYIYGVLHSPSYRTQYKEFLKVDFPRIPYPKDQAEFEHFRSYGQQLRLLHLMDNATMHRLSEKYQDIATFPESGNMMVEQVTFDAGEDDRVPRVRINDTQYFAGVPKEAWDFYIGGYRPAQKWLKDRTGRQLTFDDIAHYRRIIAVLTETDKRMKTIDLH